MKKMLLVGVIASLVGLLWENEAQACHRRHRGRRCGSCQPCQPERLESIFGTCFAGFDANGAACWIHCPDGCAAAIVNGKCVTSCADGMRPYRGKTGPDDPIRLTARDYPLGDLDSLLGLSDYAIVPEERKHERLYLRVRDRTVLDIIDILGLERRKK